MEQGAGQSLKVSPPAQRVRTGCLTCRRRHLKCDEFKPICINCRKGNRDCLRGMKVTFQPVKVHSVGLLPWAEGTPITFLDESEAIALEYKNGFEKKNSKSSNNSRSAAAKAERSRKRKEKAAAKRKCHAGDKKGYQKILPAPAPANPLRDVVGNGCDLSCKQVRRSQKILVRQSNKLLSEIQQQGLPATVLESTMARLEPFLSVKPEEFSTKCTLGNALASLHTLRQAPSAIAEPPRDKMLEEFWRPHGMFDNTKPEEYLSSEHQISFTEEFAETIGQWIDCFDGQGHFSHSLPFRALESPMLLNAMYACGAKRKLGALKKDQYDWPHLYYSTATTKLLDTLGRADTNMTDCAITSVILYVYEIMADVANGRAQHGTGSRAFINFCNWDANSGGIGTACFWLTVGLETLTCLSSNSLLTRDPKSWGVDMNITPEVSDELSPGQEATWLHRVLCIAAMMANFRARRFVADPDCQIVQMGELLTEWQGLKALCDSWNNSCPRSMHPMGYTSPKRDAEPFPRIWLVHRSAVLARLFYHVIQYLLAETNPWMPIGSSKQMLEMRLHHARQVCGISMKCKDHVVPGALIQSLALVGACLMEENERKEVIRVLDEIRTKSGWNIEQAQSRLKAVWGRVPTVSLPYDFKKEAPSPTKPVTGPHGLIGNSFQRGPLAETRDLN